MPCCGPTAPLLLGSHSSFRPLPGSRTWCHSPVRPPGSIRSDLLFPYFLISLLSPHHDRLQQEGAGWRVPPLGLAGDIRKKSAEPARRHPPKLPCGWGTGSFLPRIALHRARGHFRTPRGHGLLPSPPPCTVSPLSRMPKLRPCARSPGRQGRRRRQSGWILGRHPLPGGGWGGSHHIHKTRAPLPASFFGSARNLPPPPPPPLLSARTHRRGPQAPTPLGADPLPAQGPPPARARPRPSLCARPAPHPSPACAPQGPRVRAHAHGPALPLPLPPPKRTAEGRAPARPPPPPPKSLPARTCRDPHSRRPTPARDPGSPAQRHRSSATRVTGSGLRFRLRLVRSNRPTPPARLRACALAPAPAR